MAQITVTIPDALITTLNRIRSAFGLLVVEELLSNWLKDHEARFWREDAETEFAKTAPKPVR